MIVQHKAILDFTTSMYKWSKERAVEEARGKVDLPALVVAARNDWVLFVTGGYANPDQRGMALELIAAGFRPQYLVFCSEVYMKITPQEEDMKEDMKNYEQGDLQADFRAGDPNTVEALTFMSIDREPEIRNGQEVFHYEGSKLVFDKREIPTDIGEGRLPNQLRAAMALAAEAEEQFGGFDPNQLQVVTDVLKSIGIECTLTLALDINPNQYN